MRFGELHHTDIKAQRDRVVLLPVASLEQHGHHLPLLTDSLIGEAIVRGVEAELGEAVLCLPLLWVGAFLAAYVLRLPATYQHGRYMMPVVPVLVGLGVGERPCGCACQAGRAARCRCHGC